MRVLGIETSCDETAAAVVHLPPEGRGRILSNVIHSQIEDHRAYGGVVPEIAARAHVEKLPQVVAEALRSAGVEPAGLDGIAATAGPGLIGGLHVGVTFAKALAGAHGRPFMAVNHLEAHALTPRLAGQAAFPFVLLLVSGGHCLLALAEDVGTYRLLGTTIDDAVGEAFDKGARVLGLSYPGGPAIEAAALAGNPKAHPFPRPLAGRPGCDFSFSGLKAAVKRTADGLAQQVGGGPLPSDTVADLAASYQEAIADCLADRVGNALAPHGPLAGLAVPVSALVVSGGVAANGVVRARLEAVAGRAGLPLVAPPPALCTDNGAMVAWAGLERLRLGLTDPLDVPARPRWPLDEIAGPPPGPSAGAKKESLVSTG